MSQSIPDSKALVARLISAALVAADPAMAINRHVNRDGHQLLVDGHAYDLGRFSDVILVAVGKASIPMASAVCELIGDKVRRGVCVTKYGHIPADTHLNAAVTLTLIESAHPVPDENSMRAGECVSAVLSNCTENTLVLACISGGASALMIAPHPGIRLNTMQAINDALLKSGSDIREMNIVRSRLDRLKGGGMARLAVPATVVGLILSDVIGDPLDIIASGLTNDPSAHNTLVANNAQACAAVARQATELGYQAHILTTELSGEARVRGTEIAAAISAAKQGTCLIYGGEPTVTLRGSGKGGRNQELALAAALELRRLGASQAFIASFGTDGTDGPTDAAGAIAFADTIERAGAIGLDASAFLARNDSYSFFSSLNDLIITGPTGTNVADVVIALRT